MMIGIGLLVATLCVIAGALAALILHRREKGRRPPHAHDRSMWNGT